MLSLGNILGWGRKEIYNNNICLELYINNSKNLQILLLKEIPGARINLGLWKIKTKFLKTNGR